MERERQQRLERDLRRQQQMMDENNASMQVELSIESMPTVAHDELVTSYLKAADTYGSIVTERKTVAKALTTIQVRLIECSSVCVCVCVCACVCVCVCVC